MKNTWSLQAVARTEASVAAVKAAKIEAKTTFGLLAASMAVWRPLAL